MLKLKEQPVEDSDKKILAETIYLRNRQIEADSKAKMYLASTDYHFSPLDSEGHTTDEIRRRFGIICDWPDKIAHSLKADGIM